MRLEESDPDCAQELYEQCIKGFGKLKEGYPYMLVVMNSYAVLRERRGKFVEASSLLDSYAELQLQHNGKDHENTITAFHNAAKMKVQMGKYAEACEYYKIAAEGLEMSYGLAHDETLLVFRHLRNVLNHLGHSEEAREVADKISQGEKSLRSGD